MIKALSRFDLAVAEFFQIEDIELRIKFYKSMFVVGWFTLIVLYMIHSDVNEDIVRYLKL